MEYNVIKLSDALEMMGLSVYPNYGYVVELIKRYLMQIKAFHNGILQYDPVTFKFPYKNNEEIQQNIYSYKVPKGITLGYYEMYELSRKDENGDLVLSPTGAEIILALYKSRYFSKSFYIGNKLDEIRRFRQKGYNYDFYAKMNGIETNDEITSDNVYGGTYSVKKSNFWTYDEFSSLKNLYSFDNTINTLFVTPKVCYCESHGHKVISMTGVYEGKKLDVCYCLTCKEFYISPNGYEHYCELYGKENFPIIRLTKGKSPAELRVELNIKNVETRLHRRGYNVTKRNNLSEIARRNIIVRAIKEGFVSKAEVIKCIENNIHLIGAKDNMQDAVAKWQGDLNWLREYNIDEQIHIEIEKIENQ